MNTKSTILLPIYVLLFCIIVWFLGPISFQYSCEPFAGMFGDVKDLSNIFAPVGTLFTALATWGALYTIWSQLQQFKLQQFENNFFKLLETQIQNRNQAQIAKVILARSSSTQRHDTTLLQGIDAFKEYYDLLHTILFKLNPNIIDAPPKPLSQQLSQTIEDAQAEVIETEQETVNEILLFKTSFDILNEYSKFALWHYYRHIYHTLKYIHESTIPNKHTYIAMLRAQISTYEYIMIYYNALWSDDKPSPSESRSKFQILIEDTGLLHNIHKSLLFDKDTAGEYADKAFESSH